MTTRITSESNPRLPRPDAYTAYLNRVAADHEAFVRRRRRYRNLVRLTWASLVLLVAVVAWRIWG